jgi:Helix-turn-helix domain
MNGSLNRNYRMPSLLRGKQLLSEIAFASGFVDQSHMTRIFSRRIGMTPGEWRGGIRNTRMRYAQMRCGPLRWTVGANDIPCFIQPSSDESHLWMRIGVVRASSSHDRLTGSREKKQSH